MLCIGLSWQGANPAYDAYETALRRRAAALGISVDISWLAGKERPPLTSLLPGLNGIVFTGGPDVAPARYGDSDPAGICECDETRDAIEFALLEHVARRPIPTLGICRGAQLLNVFHGGTLVHDLGEANATHRGSPDKRHALEIRAGSALEAIAGSNTGTVNSSHHQAVDRLAEPFRRSALAADGTIEAYEYADASPHPFFLAVQWHPERMEPGSPLSDGVLDAFLKAAAVSGEYGGLASRSSRSVL